MLFRSVAAQSVRSYFEFFGCVSKAHESKNPENNPNSLSADIFDGSHVDRLTIVTQPITEINPFDVQLAKFLAPCRAGHQDIEEGVLDVAMSPVLAFYAGN